MSFSGNPEYFALLEIFTLLLFAHILGGALHRVGLSKTVGEIIAGIVLGSYALGGVIDNLLGVPLFVINSFVLLFADFSVILLIFAAGLEGGLASLRSAGAWAIFAAVAGDLVPFAATTLVFSFFYPLSTALLLGVAAGATSTAVVASLLQADRLTTTPSGQFLITVAALDDVVALLLLTVVLTVRGGTVDLLLLSGNLLYSAIAWVVLLVAAILVIPRVFHLRGIQYSHDAPLVVLFAMVVIVGALGFSALIGAFIAGLAIAESIAARRTRAAVEVLLAFFGALFFVVLGAQFQISFLLQPKVLAFAALLAGIAAAGKFIGVVGFARARFRSWRVARAVAIALIPRGEIGLVVGAVGLSIGAFDQPLLGAIILMAMLTTILGSALFHQLRPDLELADGPPSPFNRQ